ncbi:MAG: type II toxin-antitoxin system VapC family toxin [Verrucomicrobia bacterium]|nr:type II toxin-antitoxin system VapC family toxin [Verrucomicrobiota bacterium]
MNGDVLLDTSVVIPYFKKDAAIGRQLKGGHVLYLPSVVLGELYCGAYHCVHRAKPLAEIKNFLNAVGVLPVGETTSDHYGQIRAALTKAGTPIPENDIWIAALAQEYQLPLATRDQHFSLVAGLTLLIW